MYCQVRSCACWSGENTKAVLRSIRKHLSLKTCISQLIVTFCNSIDWFRHDNRFYWKIFNYIFSMSLFSVRVFFTDTGLFTGQQRKAEDHFLFHSTTSTRSRTLRHLFATLHVRWLPRIFNCNASVYQTASRWDLPPYRITIWVIGLGCDVCLLTWWIDTRFLLKRFDIRNRWIWTRFDYRPPCIASESTDQVC